MKRNVDSARGHLVRSCLESAGGMAHKSDSVVESHSNDITDV